MNGKMSELSPDVAPFVPRTAHVKKELDDGHDADLPGLSNKADAGNYHDLRQTSSFTRFASPDFSPPESSQAWQTQKRRPRGVVRRDVDTCLDVRNNAPKYNSRYAEGNASRNPLSGWETRTQTRRNTFEERNRHPLTKWAGFCDDREDHQRRFPTLGSDHRSPIDNEVKTRPGNNKREPESPKIFFGNPRMKREERDADGTSTGILARRTDDAEVKKRPPLSKTAPSFDGSKEKSRNIVRGNKSVSRTVKVKDDFKVVEFRRSRTEILEMPTVGEGEKRSVIREIKSESRESKTEVGSVRNVVVATEATVVKKKKTDGQRKKEYKNKVKQLPSVQGKVLTVTHEFYNLVTQNEPKTTRLLTKDAGEEEICFESNDFPALGDDRQDKKLIRSFKKECSVRESQNRDCDLQTDSEWSDIESHEHASKIGKTKAKCRLANETNVVVKAEDPKSSLYAASVKKTNATAKCEDRSIKSAVGSNPNELRAASTSRASKSDKEPSKKPKAKSLIEYNLLTMLNKNKNVSKDIGKRNPASSSKEGKKMGKVKPFVANILDSSAPSRRRGKEREKPARKKPTAMKKIILKEREAKKLTKSALKMTQNDAIEAIVLPAVDDPKEEVPVVVKQEEKCQTVDVNVAASEGPKPAIHTRKFREYCDQMLNPEIDETVTKLIQDLIRFQDRLYQKDPIKAKMRRRIVIGLREVTKHLKLKKLKCVVLAPNLEKIISDGGLDEAMNEIITTAVEQEVPFVFALGRRKLGRVCLKKVPVSGVGIFNYDGSEVNFKHLCTLSTAAREAYQEATRRGSEAR